MNIVVGSHFSQGSLLVPSLYAQYSFSNTRFQILVTLNIPYLLRSNNDVVCHPPSWSTIPTKLSLYIPKFDGKLGEVQSNHAMNFHLWCSSQSLVHDNIILIFFQRTLIGTFLKWYSEFPSACYLDLSSPSLVFLKHFKFPIHY